MPIAKELSQYPNEAVFTAKFLIPLFHRLGFSVVVNYHGTREFGKDLIFAEIDSFGHVVYHGMQAKFVDSVGLGNATRDLTDDAEQAFANPFIHPQTGASQRISVFYAVNAGNISDQAREHYFNRLRPQYGANVRLMDGPALVALDRMASFKRDSLVRERLTGLIHEFRYNEVCVDRAVDFYEKNRRSTFPLRFRTTATLGVLTVPIILDSVFIQCLNAYWAAISHANHILESTESIATLEEMFPKKPQLVRSVYVHQVVSLVHGAATHIEERIMSFLAELGAPVADLTIPYLDESPT